jgi:hypothetical protein
MPEMPQIDHAERLLCGLLQTVRLDHQGNSIPAKPPDPDDPALALAKRAAESDDFAKTAVFSNLPSSCTQ